MASRTGSPTGPAVLGPDPTESARLDVAAATRLAEEAHRRQRATRAALEAERAALAAPDSRLRPTSTDPAPAPALPVPSSTPAAPEPADEPPLGWTRHPLVSGELPSAEQIEAADERACEVPPRREATGAPETEIASDAPRALQTALDEAQTELDRLRRRLASNDLELEAREAERQVLRQTLVDREREITVRGEQLEEVTTRLESQTRILDDLRSELAHERRRHQRAQEILQSLRRTLTDVVDDALESPGEHALLQTPLAPDSTTERLRPASSALPPDLPPDPSHAVPRAVPRAVPHEPPDERPRRTESGARIPGDAIASELFDAWQDDQIRRHFGPLGIDSLVDLLREPLARRARSSDPEIQILLLGRDAWRQAVELAAGLLQGAPPPFVIHVADPTDPDADGLYRIGAENPLRELLRPSAAPQTPEALSALLASTGAQVVVSRHFLSELAEPAPWLDSLAGAHAAGSALLFAERTGVEVGPPSPAMSALGDRIWELMPARYKHIAGSDEIGSSWSEIFERRPARAANGCLEVLRQRFELELFARFGYLAEPFVGPEIGPNFSAEAPRDRRFLRQVADVDDRKIEAGLAPALHFVARIDPRVEADPQTRP